MLPGVPPEMVQERIGLGLARLVRRCSDNSAEAQAVGCRRSGSRRDSAAVHHDRIGGSPHGVSFLFRAPSIALLIPLALCPHSEQSPRFSRLRKNKGFIVPPHQLRLTKRNGDRLSESRARDADSTRGLVRTPGTGREVTAASVRPTRIRFLVLGVLFSLAVLTYLDRVCISVAAPWITGSCV